MPEQPPAPPTVEDIVHDYLVSHGYTGLYRDDCMAPCGCTLGDLYPCCEMQRDCVPAYQLPCGCMSTVPPPAEGAPSDHDCDAWQ